MKFLKTLSLMASLFICGCGAQASNPDIEVVPPVEFQTRFTADPEGYLLDVRTPEEFAKGHIKGAHLLNWLDTDKFKQDAADLDKSKTIYIYCRSGRRSNDAAGYLSDQGYTVVDMKGGILSWEKENLPTTSADK